MKTHPHQEEQPRQRAHEIEKIETQTGGKYRTEITVNLRYLANQTTGAETVEAHVYPAGEDHVPTQIIALIESLAPYSADPVASSQLRAACQHAGLRIPPTADMRVDQDRAARATLARRLEQIADVEGADLLAETERAELESLTNRLKRAKP